MPDTSSKLGQYQRRLLDLSMRNRLLNFRDMKSGTLRLAQPSIEELWNTLVRKGRPLLFPLPDEQVGGVPQRASYSPGKTAPVVETDRAPADLRRSLARLEKVARASIEEQGINILHVGFGLLQWRDERGAEHHAPLVLVPVSLSRPTATSRFVLQPADDDPVVNPTFSYMLEQIYKVQLPQLDPDKTLGTYFNSVELCIQLNRGWLIHESVVLSTFQFQKLAMYHDLEASISHAK